MAGRSARVHSATAPGPTPGELAEGSPAGLPPGPRTPVAVQTVQWIAQPTALLRRSQALYGEPFTLRMAWSDGPMVLVSDPEEIRRVYAAEADVL
jgi:cytochrome P450 family 135